ncbi:MAG: hypothetical protein EF813_12475 [Methanosarcinales archaeon]|nr:MAG: hypothetical protein EF813_12475 [Methanosarcinales archaeon]
MENKRKKNYALFLSRGVTDPPAAISQILLPQSARVIDRSCGCLRDPGITGRFRGYDVGGGRGSGGVLVSRGGEGGACKRSFGTEYIATGTGC